VDLLCKEANSQNFSLPLSYQLTKYFFFILAHIFLASPMLRRILAEKNVTEDQPVIRVVLPDAHVQDLRVLLHLLVGKHCHLA
jgi:hypothetical protein